MFLLGNLESGEKSLFFSPLVIHSSIEIKKFSPTNWPGRNVPNGPDILSVFYCAILLKPLNNHMSYIDFLSYLYYFIRRLKLSIPSVGSSWRVTLPVEWVWFCFRLARLARFLDGSDDPKLRELLIVFSIGMESWLIGLFEGKMGELMVKGRYGGVYFDLLGFSF